MATIKQLLNGLRSDVPDAWYQAGAERHRLGKSPAATAAVIAVLREGRHELQRWEAAYILGCAYTKVAARALFEAFRNPEEAPSVRGACAEQLAIHSFRRARELNDAYIRGLDDSSPIVRFWCIYALAVRHVTTARARLQKIAATDHERCPGWSKVSTEAKWALAHLDELPLEDRVGPGPKPSLTQPPRATGSAFLRRAHELASGGEHGAVIVRDKQIVAEGADRTLLYQDPTATAEIVAIREACRRLETFDLNGCEIYCSHEPDQMTLGAIYWARLARIFYAHPRPPIETQAVPAKNMSRREGRKPFSAWKKSAGKIRY